ncbi:hypothetical protein J2T13_003442 [Paenibacillus sp. DS2015]
MVLSVKLHPFSFLFFFFWKFTVNFVRLRINSRDKLNSAEFSLGKAGEPIVWHHANGVNRIVYVGLIHSPNPTANLVSLGGYMTYV